MKTANDKVAQIRDALRRPYTFPGAYPIHFITYDGCICHKCVRENYKAVLTDTKARVGGWQIIEVAVLWEGQHYCAQCSDPLETAYGDDEEQDFMEE